MTRLSQVDAVLAHATCMHCDLHDSDRHQTGVIDILALRYGVRALSQHQDDCTPARLMLSFVHISQALGSWMVLFAH